MALLDITWRPQVVRVLLQTHRSQLAELLADIPTDVDLWDASDVTLKQVDIMWDVLTSIEGIGTASATKLLARKRPRLCPISDSLVIKAIDVPGRTWDVLRQLLQDSGARADVEALRPAAAAPRACSGSWTWRCGYRTASRLRPRRFDWRLGCRSVSANPPQSHALLVL